MKKTLTILLIFVSIVSLSQDFRQVDWKTRPADIRLIGVDTFKVTVNPIDYNDKGVGQIEVGYYLIDWIARAFEIIAFEADTITVVDLASENLAPVENQIAHVYESIVSGDTAFHSIGGVDVSTIDDLSRWKDVARNNELFGRVISRKLENPVDSITFKPDVNYLSNFTEYTFKLDTTNRTIAMTNNESEIAMQLGQELWLEIKNGNGVTFDNGAFVYIVESAGAANPTVMLADNRSFETVEAVGMLTHDVESNTFGFATVYGSVGGLNTLGTIEGQEVYLDTIGGARNWSVVNPSFPAYEFQMGYILKVDEFDGKIFINPKGQVDDILHNINNANMIEPFDFRVTSDGVTVTGTLSSAISDTTITIRWSDGFTTISVPQTIEIPQGTSNVSQFSVVYLLKSTGLLTTSTTYFPITNELKTIAKLETWDAAKTLTKGQKGNQNYNDWVAHPDAGVGRISQIGKWQRLQPLKYVPESGGIGSMDILNVSGIDSVKFAFTQALFSQANEQIFPEYDMNVGDDIHVYNYPDHPDTTFTNLANILIDAEGNSLAGRSWTWEFWVVQNKTGEPSHMFVNLPLGSYSSSALAIRDASNYKVKTIPYNMQSYSGFAYEAVMTHTNPGGGTWTLDLLSDTKGDYPFSGGSSGSTGGVVQYLTDLLDFPNSYVGQGSKILQVDPLESAVSFIAKSDININDFDTTGTTWSQSQVVGLGDILDLKVPYTGATGNVDLGLFDLYADSASITNGVDIGGDLYVTGNSKLNDSVFIGNYLYAGTTTNDPETDYLFYKTLTADLGTNFYALRSRIILNQPSNIYGYASVLGYSSIINNNDYNLVRGIYGAVDIIGDANVTNGIGSYNLVISRGSGTIDGAHAVYGRVQNEGTGTMSIASSFKSKAPINSGGGTIDTYAGLLIEDYTAITGITSGYSILTQGTNSRVKFEGTGESIGNFSVPNGTSGLHSTNYNQLTTGIEDIDGLTLLINGTAINNANPTLDNVLTNGSSSANAMTVGGIINNGVLTVQSTAPDFRFKETDVTGQGSVYRFVNSNKDFTIRSTDESLGSSLTLLKFDNTGYVQLTYAGAVKLQTNTNGVDITGTATATKYFVSTLNTAPSSATDTGTTGEIRITATYIYVCSATNTWVRTQLTTW